MRNTPKPLIAKSFAESRCSGLREYEPPPPVKVTKNGVITIEKPVSWEDIAKHHKRGNNATEIL